MKESLYENFRKEVQKLHSVYDIPLSKCRDLFFEFVCDNNLWDEYKAKQPDMPDQLEEYEKFVEATEEYLTSEILR